MYTRKSREIGSARACVRAYVCVLYIDVRHSVYLSLWELKSRRLRCVKRKIDGGRLVSVHRRNGGGRYNAVVVAILKGVNKGGFEFVFVCVCVCVCVCACVCVSIERK